MKKAQVLKFWTALGESTNNKERISAFSNKHGYGGQRTLVRFVQAYDGFRQGLTSEEIAKKSGWSLSLVNKIREWWETDFVKIESPKSDNKPAGWVDYSDVWPARYAPPQILPIVPKDSKRKKR
ncbi:hypothetical protein ACFLWY_01500 [Chloroflexota bacterium]